MKQFLFIPHEPSSSKHIIYEIESETKKSYNVSYIGRSWDSTAKNRNRKRISKETKNIRVATGENLEEAYLNIFNENCEDFFNRVKESLSGLHNTPVIIRLSNITDEDARVSIYSDKTPNSWNVMVGSFKLLSFALSESVEEKMKKSFNEKTIMKKIDEYCEEFNLGMTEKLPRVRFNPKLSFGFVENNKFWIVPRAFKNRNLEPFIKYEISGIQPTSFQKSYYTGIGCISILDLLRLTNLPEFEMLQEMKEFEGFAKIFTGDDTGLMAIEKVYDKYSDKYGYESYLIDSRVLDCPFEGRHESLKFFINNSFLKIKTFGFELYLSRDITFNKLRMTEFGILIDDINSNSKFKFQNLFTTLMTKEEFLKQVKKCLKDEYQAWLLVQEVRN